MRIVKTTRDFPEAQITVDGQTFTFREQKGLTPEDVLEALMKAYVLERRSGKLGYPAIHLDVIRGVVRHDS